ncbi:hypothetical protein MLD38_038051 [Melastoma candidum]|uniref:Uncharacterized protein n=1 Tax=Melastoma candidum TaxID=119954 RepID=A0ACB9L004_9MYRT|nr:hypothetical protein MLD38_038051 [Melastoma candidum]
MSNYSFYSQPEGGRPVPYFVNGQYYYDYKPDYYSDATEPRVLEFLEDFGELCYRRHELFHKIFPESHDDYRAVLDGALAEARMKKRTRAGTVQRSLSIGSPRVRSRGLGREGDEVLRLERFKVKTVDFEDDEAGAGGGGPVAAAGNKSKKWG